MSTWLTALMIYGGIFLIILVLWFAIVKSGEDK